MNRTAIDALGWTLVHFLWQGALIAAALCAVDMALAKSRATLRYLAACVAFVSMLLVPLGTFFALRAPAASSGAGGTIAAPLSPIPTARSTSAEIVGRPASLVSPSRPASLGPSLSRSSLTSVRRSLSRLLPWVVQLWTVGVVVLALRLIGGWWLVRRLVRSSANVTLEAWQARLQELGRRMGVSRPVRLCRSALVEVPTAIGWLRPMILLPASTLTGLSTVQIEAILAHELAHIRRHDYFVNLLQSVVEMLLFYHPAVWWVSKRIREERELCCDDLAIRLSGDAVSYARALYELERLRGAAPSLALAASGGSLTRRIARLLGLPGRPWEAATRGLVGLVAATAVISLLALSGLEPAGGLASAATRIVRSHPSLARVVAEVRAPVAAAVTSSCPSIAAAPALAAVSAAAAAEVAAAAAPCAAAVAEAALVTAACPAPVASAACQGPEAPAEDDAADATVTGRFTADEWKRMREHGVSQRYVAALEPNLPDLSADQIITLAEHGVSSIYVANLRHAGLERPSVEDLVRLAEHGVNSTYVANVRQAGLDEASVDDLVRLADHGVSSAYIRGLKGIDPDDLSVDQLIDLSSHGVTSEWYSAMDWMGLSEFSVDEAIQLRNVGITPEYANKLKLATHRRLGLDELRQLATQGVTSEYAARMYVLFGSDLDVDKLLQMRHHGVGTDYAEQMMVAAGPLEVPALVELHDQGVDPGYAYEMSVLGRLDPKDLIRLHQNGVTADFVQEARKRGYAHPSVSELIRLYQHGLPANREG